MAGLCRLLNELRSGAQDVYNTYSADVHDPLHAVMNKALDDGSPHAPELIAAENALEMALLSDGARTRQLRSLRRVVELLRRSTPDADKRCEGSGSAGHHEKG